MVTAIDQGESSLLPVHHNVLYGAWTGGLRRDMHALSTTRCGEHRQSDQAEEDGHGATRHSTSRAGRARYRRRRRAPRRSSLP